MSYDLSNILVVGVSSRSLFHLEKENEIFEKKGLDKYMEYQLKHVNDVPPCGTAFRLVKNILSLNTDLNDRKVEILLLSKNNAATSLRITNAIEHYGLDITRSAWTGGEPLAKYLGAYKVNLFLSANNNDVQRAINAGYAAARIYELSENAPESGEDNKKIKIAFDGDAVLFSADSEKIYKEQGLEAFLKHEKENAKKPLPDGPFAPLLKTISRVQARFDAFNAPIRTALITSRNSPAHERVVRTLHSWNVRIDEAFFLGGIMKHEILAAFEADIFFDDQDVHCSPASDMVPTAIVPIRGHSSNTALNLDAANSAVPLANSLRRAL